MYLDNFKGNFKTLDSLNDWLDEFFHTKTAETKPYVIIHGSSGNGKTFMVECFAKDYKVDLLRFTADDIEDKDSLDVIEKSLNLQMLETTNLKKIVLIDDVEDIRNKKRLYTLHETCNYPIIFTTNEIKGLSDDFVGKALVLEMKKPLTSEIQSFLEEEAQRKGIKCDCIEEIASKSYSIRTALQALSLGRPIEKNAPLNSISSNLKLIVQRALKEELTYPTLVAAFRNVKEYDDKSYQLREMLCRLDEIWHVEFFKDKERTLDPLYINTIPFIETLKLEYKKPEKKVKPKEPKKKKDDFCMAGLAEKEEKVERRPHIDSWL